MKKALISFALFVALAAVIGTNSPTARANGPDPPPTCCGCGPCGSSGGGGGGGGGSAFAIVVPMGYNGAVTFFVPRHFHRIW